jgi:uncharacterized membrane protein YciS (DUF1049 family)
VTYSTGLVLLAGSQVIEGMFELSNLQYILLLVGFAVVYLVSNISLIRIDLASPIGDRRE